MTFPADNSIQGKMTSRNVLQELSVTFSERQHKKHDCLTEEKVSMSLSLSQPTPSLSTPVECAASDDHKENHIPADSRLFAKEASMYEKNATDSDFTTPKRVSAGTNLPGAKSLTSIDLSKVTVADLGISPESFTKFSGKSPKSLQKHRRRSTIGVRGSPEMNFLIRQIALQRSKVKPEPDYLSSPFTSPKNSLLKSKMSAFKDAFQTVDENEGNAPFPGPSDVNQSKNGQQERFKPPEKRMKLSHNVDFPINEPVKIVEENDAVNLCEKISDSDCLVATGPCTSLSVTSEQTCDSPLHEEVFIAQSPKRLKRKVMFRDPLSPKSMSPYQVPRNEGATVAYPCPKPCLRPALKKSPKTALTLTEEYEGKLLYCTEECSLDQDENVKVGLRGLACAIDSVKKKKVTFGRELSPELFDKTLPANTPVRRGSTPYRYGTAVSESPAKSFLDDFIEPLPQPDFDNAELILPLFSICFEDQEMSCNSTSSSSIPEHTDETILEEKPRSTTGESKSVTLNLHVEHVHSPVSEDNSPDSSLPMLSGEVQTPSDITVSTTKTDSILNCGRTTRSALNRQSYSSEESSDNGSQSENQCSDPVTAKTVAKKTISRKPVTAKKTLIKASLRQGKKGPGRKKKSVRKPQFKNREIASKRPLLSPIPELPECLPTPPASVNTDMVSGKQMLKRDQKIKVAKKSSGKVYEMKDFSAPKDHGDNLVIRKLDEDRVDPLNSTIVKCRIMDILEVTPIPGGLGFGHNLSPSKQSPPQNTTAVMDSADQARGQSSEVCSVTKEPVVKQSNSAMVWIDTAISISAADQPGKDKSAKARRRSDRHSVTCYSAQTHVFQDDIVHEMDVSHTRLRTEQISLCPNENTEDKYPGDSKPPGTSQQQVPVQDFANEMMHLSTSLADQLSRRQVLVSLVDNTNNFAMENHSTMSPSVDEIAAIMEDPTLYNRKPEKKVRRSMRLRRDSGTSGLFWVQEEEKGREEKGRRRSMNLSVESPKWLCKNDLKCPVEESQTMAPSAGRKSRRKTICLSTLQEA
uniref:PP1-binding domain-containing protein n=1 Tax=Leptobrachium leishanense TaxID=445787 RepID=A0A8C5W7Y3_9ANUR